MNALTGITEFLCQYQFYLGMNILHILPDHKATVADNFIDHEQFLVKGILFGFGQQADTPEHNDMGHRPKYIIPGQQEVKLPVLSQLPV